MRRNLKGKFFSENLFKKFFLKALKKEAFSDLLINSFEKDF